MLMLSWGILGLAIVGAICRRGGERVWWLGFAVFGCGYMVLAIWSENNFNSLGTTTLLLYLSSWFDPNIPQPAASSTGSLHWTYMRICHCLVGPAGGLPRRRIGAAAFWYSGERKRAADCRITTGQCRGTDLAAPAGGHLADRPCARRVSRGRGFAGGCLDSGPA